MPPSSNNALPPGTVVGDYTIQGVVGEGGFGVVYRAFDNGMQREVAIKEYMPNALARRSADGHVELRAPQYEATFHAGRRSFVNEAKLLAQFDHKALVKVLRFFEANDTAYMVMPLYQGRTLKQILRESPKVDEPWIKAMLAPLLDALETLHGARCFHRDVAPDNILILDDGGPLLLDFGAARRIIGDMTQAVTVVIKPGYAPVEQYAEDNSLQQGPWTDIYALAAVVRLAITGKPPATSVTRMVSDPVKPLAEVATGFGPSFLRAIDYGLAVRPEDRPQSIAEFRQALGLAVVSPRITLPPSATQRLAPAATLIVPPPPPRAAAAPSAPPSQPSPPPHAEATGPIGETVPMRSHKTMPQTPAPAIPHAAAVRSSPPAAARSRSQWLPIVIVGVLMIAVVGAGYLVMQAVTSPPARESVARAPAPPVTPAPAPTPAPSPPPSAAPSPPAAVAPSPPAPAAEPAPPPVAVAPQPAAATVAPPPEPPPAQPTAAPPVAAVAPPAVPPTPPTPTGRVMLDIKPWGEVVVDGRARGLSPPLKVLQLTVGPHRIEVRNPAGAVLTRDVKVSAGARVEISHTFK